MREAPIPDAPTKLVHSDATGETVLASDVDVADSFVSRARGLMFRRQFPEGSALVFPFDRTARRSLHMVCVPFPIDAVWVVDGRVEQVERLRPMVGLAFGRADTIVELPAGAASEVEPGDRIRVE